MATLSKHDLDVGLRRLGELAVVRGIELELVVVGGAAMVLGFDAREATKDVDVVIRAPAAAIVRQLAADLAEELGWPTDWLNDAAKGLRRPTQSWSDPARGSGDRRAHRVRPPPARAQARGVAG